MTTFLSYFYHCQLLLPVYLTSNSHRQASLRELRLCPVSVVYLSRLVTLSLWKQLHNVCCSSGGNHLVFEKNDFDNVVRVTSTSVWRLT